MAQTREQAERYRSRVRGCLLGGAIGDALGAPVEFWAAEQILRECPDGVRSYLDGAWPAGSVTDDTQMTLFTMQGLIQAGIRLDRGIGFTLACVHDAYVQWHATQRLSAPPSDATGVLAQLPWLYAQRAPGNTCLTALRQTESGAARFGERAHNDSKGCGGVMRVAPVGLLPVDAAADEWFFDAAAEVAGYTHGHVTGRLASGALASVVHHIVAGQGLDGALDATVELLGARDGHEETSTALQAARSLAADGAPGVGAPGVAAVESLGGGWVAEEALAIAVYAALAYSDPEQMLDALSLAVTHSGDSDSTGAICGNILGALHGETALPAELLFCVEGRRDIAMLADDFVLEFTQSHRLHGDYGPFTAWPSRFHS